MHNERNSDDARATVDRADAATVAERLQEVSPAASIGEQLSGLGEISRLKNYTIQKELGRGGMGVVYAAHDNQLGRRVAVKTLRDHGNIEYRRRLMDEARVMAQLAHPNVVTVFEIGVADGVAFIVMEYIDGVTLGRWLAEASRSLAEILSVFSDAGEGLIAAHERNLVHRDFKPGNVMRGQDGRVRVMDFGLARSARALNETLGPAPSSEAESAARRTGIAGTPAYMPPEQFRGRRTDTASDQFSFCVALYEALYGERPFLGETKEELWEAVERGKVRDPPHASDVPEWLRAVLLQGLKADRSERFKSMRSLLDAFAGGLESSGVPRSEDIIRADELDRYLHKLEAEHEYLPLAGFHAKSRLSLRLGDLYVPLDAIVDRGGDGRGVRSNARVAHSSQEPLALVNAFSRASELKRRSLVLLGDPGSGKTTHLKQVLLKVIRDKPEAVGLPSGAVPVFLPLQALSNREAGLPGLICKQLKNPSLGLASDFGERLCKRGRLLLLLDGLDEVADPKERELVARWLEDEHKKMPDSTMLVSCRYPAYTKDIELNTHFLKLHLRPFGAEQMQAFVRNWYRLVEAELIADPEQAAIKAKAHADDLLGELSRPEFTAAAQVYQMTRNPLLLTGICLVHHAHGRLPRPRALLHEETITVLLERWHERRGDVVLSTPDAVNVVRPVVAQTDGSKRERQPATNVTLLEPVASAITLPETSENTIAASVATIVDRLYARRASRQGSPESHAHTLVIDEAIQLVRRNCMPDVGSVIAGAQLEKIIGYGTFGTVWQAYDSGRQQRVAVKVFRLEALGEGQMLYRFGRSIRAMKLLSEPSRRKRHGRAGRVVEFHNADSTGLAFSMELLGGGDLREIARLNWELEKKLGVMIEVCEALEYSHANGVIHRDIKPANIVLDVRGMPVLTDFDIADIKFATSLSTSVEGGLGTPIFAAPEQLVELEQRADESADVYSLGRLLHFLLLERSPGLALEKEPSIGNLFGEPAALVEVVRRATQHDPRKRFRSVSEMRRALEICMSRAAAWKTVFLRTSRALGRNWQLVTIAAFVLAGLVTALAYQADSVERERTAAEQAHATAERERELKLIAEEANSETTNAYARFADLSEKLQEVNDRENDLTLERSRLIMRLSAQQGALAGLERGSASHADLVEKIAASKTELAKVDAHLGQLEDELRALQGDLDVVKRKRPVVASGQPEDNCMIGLACKNFGQCSASLGNCIVESDADCKMSELCTFQGQCTFARNRCMATSDADCKMSKGCADIGWCTVKDGDCTAASNADCQMSKDCSVWGKCTQDNGTCVAASNADCEASKSCLSRGQCSAKDGVCIGG